LFLREGDQPLLGLFVMMRSGDLPEPMRQRTWSEPPLIIRAADALNNVAGARGEAPPASGRR